MSKIKKLILIRIPMSICNFRCHYCYLTQRDEHFQGIQPYMQYTPQQVAEALSKKRLFAGKEEYCAYINLCADGETLLTKDIDLYIKALAEEGHYIEIVTNLTITPMLEKILHLDAALLKRIEFKCSFHYLELKKKNLLDLFADNVNKIWNAGASANIEIIPSDELIPYLDEVTKYSMKNFGALPHVTIARDDRTKKIDYFTSLPMEEYDRIWSGFDSDFWKYKKMIFGKKQKEFCYAGMWSVYVDLATGMASQCYCGKSLGNIFENPDVPLKEEPIGKCSLSHCYNGHALLTLGLIPHATDVRYGMIRNRIKANGGQWLQPELFQVFNTQCLESNEELTWEQKVRHSCRRINYYIVNLPKYIIRKSRKIFTQ